MGNASMARFALVLMIPLAAACGADAADPVSHSTAPIVNGTPFTDTVGYVSLDVGCSGTMVSPQWVLTAGHCFRSAPNDNPIRMYTSTTVYLGTDTTNGQTSSDVFIHPNWWHPGETPPNQPTATFWNSGYDVALVRLPSPQPPYSQYPGHYYNQLSNAYMNAGEWVTCAGYGYTSAPFRGGGIGDLRNAQLPVTFVGQITTLAAWSSNEMIEVLPNNGQIIDNGTRAAVATPRRHSATRGSSPASPRSPFTATASVNPRPPVGWSIPGTSRIGWTRTCTPRRPGSRQTAPRPTRSTPRPWGARNGATGRSCSPPTPQDRCPYRGASTTGLSAPSRPWTPRNPHRPGDELRRRGRDDQPPRAGLLSGPNWRRRRPLHRHAGPFGPDRAALGLL